MRPNSPYQHHLVARLFKGNDMVVYAVPRGEFAVIEFWYFERLEQDNVLTYRNGFA